MCCGENPLRDLFSGPSSDWYSSGWIAWLPVFWMRWPSSGLTSWFIGIGLDFDRSGVGNPGGAAGHRDPQVDPGHEQVDRAVDDGDSPLPRSGGLCGDIYVPPRGEAASRRAGERPRSNLEDTIASLGGIIAENSLSAS
jgi:hypothetical protein